MSKDNFNPTDWLPAKETSTAEPHTEKATANPGSLQDDIETVTQRIESSATDITAGYANWRDLGFALAEALGESGRGIYHRISRFIFYVLNLRLVWNDVFRRSSDTTLDEYFQTLGKEFSDFHTILSGCPDIRFRLTEDQAADFNSKFDSWQSAYSDSCGDEFVASVRRLGLITFRIAMILSALRIMEDGNFETDLLCLDTDYQSAMTIAEVILQHNAHIFLTLPKAAAQSNAASSGSSAANAHRAPLQHQQFLEALPVEFDRKIYSDTASALSISPRTADRIVHRWCASGQLINTAHGKYRKKE